MSETPRTNESKHADDKPSIWRHPVVISAVIAGVFAILAIVFEHYFSAERRSDRGRQPVVEKGDTRTDTPPGPGPIELTGPISERITQVMRALEQRAGGLPDISTRLQAIAALEIMAGENPPHTFYAKAVDILVAYVKKNIDERRKGGDGVEVDPRPPHMVRPNDIVAAIAALQVIRRASRTSVPVSLGSVDFRKINLSNLDMEGFYFGHADFSYGALSNCRCRNADFRHARFEGTAVWGTKEGEQPADFRGANFLKSDFARSKWANVDFTGSNIQEAVGQRQAGLMADPHGLTSEQRALFTIFER